MGYRIGGGAPTASVPLFPLPVRALRASQGHVGAVSAAWPAAAGPGQAAREEGPEAKAGSSPYVAVEFDTGLQPTAGEEGGGSASPPLSAWPYVTGGDCCADVTALFADVTALFAKFFVLEEMVVAYAAVFSLTMSLASLIFSLSVKAMVCPYKSPRQPRSLNWSGVGGRQVLRQWRETHGQEAASIAGGQFAHESTG